MNTITTVDPFTDGVSRVVRAHARDGLGELGHGAVLAAAAVFSGAKLWAPDAIIPVALAFLAFAFLLRHFTDKLRQRIAPARTGYVGQGSLRPGHLLLVLIPGAVIALLVWLGLRHPAVPLLVIASFLGGLEILKGGYAGVTRMVILGAASILFAAALAFTGWGFLYGLVVWSSVTGAVYLGFGGWRLWSYLR